MQNIDYEPYLVRLQFTYEVNEDIEIHYASGVIVNPFESSNYLYIFTSKHTFEKEVENNEYPDDIKKVLFDDEYIKDNLVIELLKRDNREYDKSNCTTELYPTIVKKMTNIFKPKYKKFDLDLLIFEIYIEDIEVCINPLYIDRNIFKEVVVTGFPSIRDGLPYGYDSNFCRDYDDIHFEVKSNEDLFTKEIDEFNAIKGISGGGVFIEKKNRVYLIGIEIEYQKPKSFKCINLQTIYPLINDILKSRIDIVRKPISLDHEKLFTMEMVKVDLVDKSVYMSIYPVTFEEYDLFCIEQKKKKADDGFFGRGKRPVINVSWHDANEYCKWLSTCTNLNYILPSSKDWEEIASINLPNENPQNEIICDDTQTEEINHGRLGVIGISDMLGNVSEWCSDGEGNKKIIKGGSFLDKRESLDISNSKLLNSTTVRDRVGFRVLLIN